MALIAFGPRAFINPDTFWDTAVRYRFLTPEQVEAVLETGHRLGDESIYRAVSYEGLPNWLRPIAYAWRLPIAYASSLNRAMLFTRVMLNHADIGEIESTRGQIYMGQEQPPGFVAPDASLRDFVPLPVFESYFDRTVAALTARGIQVVFVHMPINDSTKAAMTPALISGFTSFMAATEAKFSTAVSFGQPLEAWPDSAFGDTFAHLKPEGARAFSRELAACVIASRDAGGKPRPVPGPCRAWTRPQG